MHRLYLIDASIYVFRAWFSMDEGITDKHGNPVNAVYGFAHFLAQLLEQTRPTHIAALFDESLSSSFRNKIYAPYKANREPAPPELKQQFQLCRRLCRAVGIKEMASARYEADDLIGSLAERFRGKYKQVVIVSRDKDLVQLLGDNDLFWDFAEDRKLDHAGATTHFGVRPEQMADFLALAGDSVDNIPGVPGVGKKTAQRLLSHFQDLDQLYQGLEQVAGLDMRAAARIHGLLERHRDMAYLCRQLSEIKCDVKLRIELADLQWLPDSKKTQRFFNALGVGQGLTTRFARLME
jgi:5'-3' exonuclease